MRTKTLTTMGLMAIACLPLAGCPQVRIPVEFSLAGGLGTFAVTAGEPTQNRGTGSLADTQINIGSATMKIDPSNITITPANGGGGKGTVNLQAGGTLVVSASIASADAVDTVCESGEKYGPFDIALDVNYQPVSVDPSSVTLSQNTIDLINGGEFSLCIEVTSPIDGTVTIAALSFSLGL
ncbi:MAG: hypothetical protein V1790_02585 [Planctomycetota bacterium]